jgi:hypothetical protein
VALRSIPPLADLLEHPDKARSLPRGAALEALRACRVLLAELEYVIARDGPQNAAAGLYEPLWTPAQARQYLGCSKSWLAEHRTELADCRVALGSKVMFDPQGLRAFKQSRQGQE